MGARRVADWEAQGPAAETGTVERDAVEEDASEEDAGQQVTVVSAAAAMMWNFRGEFRGDFRGNCRWNCRANTARPPDRFR
jgi:hypothetical protein